MKTKMNALKQNVMNKFILIVAGIMVAVSSFATTYYTTGNGAWGAAIWNAGNTNGAGSVLPTLFAGDILVIDDQVTVASGIITINPAITINLTTTSATQAKLIFQTGGKLVLTSASSVINLSRTSASFPMPMVDGSGSGGSNIIDIGGNTVWQANNGDITGIGQLNSSSTNGALPVKLLFFNGVQTDDAIALNWATASEENFDKFVIQHSVDGKSFSAIAEVSGAGNSKVKLVYDYTDHAISVGKNYYRLKSVDFDGKFEYSKVVFVNSSASKKMWISHNPSCGNSVHFSTNFNASEADRIILLNNQGKIVAEGNASKVKGQFEFDNALSAGVYLLKYLGNDAELLARVVVK
jgi:hypothetical protein